MPTESIYKDVLLDHFRHPRNKGGLKDADIVRRGSNPKCGDEVEVGLYLQGSRIDRVRFRGRGCSICIASASMMTEAVGGMATDQASRLCASVNTWFESDVGGIPETVSGELEALSAVRDYPSRRRCVLLSWEALFDAIDAL